MRDTIEYRSSNGVETVYADLYTPEGQPNGIVQIVHGMCEHIGRYQPVMEWLCSQGYAVCGHDQIGHGRSCAVNGTGYFAPKDGWDCLVKDARQLTILARGRWPGVPVYLLGHSMGSFVAREYITRYRDLAGVVLSGTGGPSPVYGPARALIAGMKAVKGEKYRSERINDLVFGGMGKQFPESPFAWLSRDTEAVAAYEADPLCGFIFTLSAYGDLMTLLDRVNRREWAERVPRGLAVYLFSGAEDPVGANGEGVRTVAKWLAEAGVRPVKMKLYPGGRHEMLNETNRGEVWGDLLAWLESRGKKLAAME